MMFSRETFLTCDYQGRPEHTPEAEGLTIVADGDAVRLEDHEGSVRVASRVELLRALGATDWEGKPADLRAA